MGYFDFEDEEFGFYRKFKKRSNKKINESFETDKEWYGFNHFNNYYDFSRAEISALHTDFGAVKFSNAEKSIIGSSINDIYKELKGSFGEEKINGIKDSLDVILPDILSSFYSIDKEYDVNKYNKDWVDILCKLDFKSYGFLTKGNFFFSEKFTKTAAHAITNQLLRNTQTPEQSGCDFNNKKEQKNKDEQNKSEDGNNKNGQQNQEDQEEENKNTSNQSGQSGNNSVQSVKNSIAESVSNALNKFSSGSEVTKMLNAKKLVDEINSFENKDEETHEIIKREEEDYDDNDDDEEESLDRTKINSEKELFNFIIENYDFFQKKSSFSKLINKTLTSSKNAFIPSIKTHEESLFEAESINGIEDYIYLIEPLDALITELKTLDNQKSLKFDIYIDVSGSMQDKMTDDKGNRTKSKGDFVKQCAYRLYKEDMIGNLYSFGDRITPVNLKTILYNTFNEGTYTERVFNNIIKTQRPSMIITDAEDNLLLSSKYNKKQLKLIIDNTFMAVLTDKKITLDKNEFRDGNALGFNELIKNKKYAYINTMNSKLYQALKISNNTTNGYNIVETKEL